MDEVQIKPMFRYIILSTLLLTTQHGYAQPRANNGQSTIKQSNSNSATIALNNSPPQIDNKADAERATQDKKRYDEDAAFKKERLRQNEIIADSTIILAIFGGLSFIVAVIYAFYARKQWKAINQQAEHAGKQADLTREARIKLERPFIFLTQTQLVWYPNQKDGTPEYGVKTFFENSGNTPTKDMQLVVEFHLLEGKLPEGFDFPIIKPFISTIVAPKSMIQGPSNVISAADMVKIQEGTLFYYFWGKAIYRDNFKGTREHKTLFCREIGYVSGNPLNPEPGLEVFFNIYSEHNKDE